MKIKIEMEISNCSECPFAQSIYEHGYCGTDCTKLGAYHTIPQEGIDEKCPFKKENKNFKNPLTNE